MQRLTFENNQIIYPATGGFTIGTGVSGTATFIGNSITELNVVKLNSKMTLPRHLKLSYRTNSL